MIYLFIIFQIIGNTFPDWFLNPPEGTIAVMARDQYTAESRFWALYSEANFQLMLENNPIYVYGYDAMRKSDFKYNRYDKPKLRYDVIGDTDVDYLENRGLQLVEVKRIRKKAIFGLFAKDSTVLESIRRIKEKPAWTKEGNDKNLAVGFAGGNWSIRTNWEYALKYALFQLTMNNNLMIFSDIDQGTYEDESVFLSYRNRDQLDMTEYLFRKGIKIVGRYYDPEDDLYYIKIEKVR
jgi:hypothetical protein